MWDILYKLLKKSKENYYKEKYKWYIINKINPFNNFYKLNIMFDFETIWKTIWTTNLWHLMIILKTLDLKTNEVSFSILNLSDDRLRKLKTLFKKENLIKKFKLSTEKESKYYFNPNILFYWKWVNIELVDNFN